MKKYIQTFLDWFNKTFNKLREEGRKRAGVLLQKLRSNAEGVLENIRYWYKTEIRSKVIVFTGRIKMVCSYWKLTKDLLPFDYSIVLEAERHHLKILYKCIDKYRSHVDAPEDLKWMKKCLDLLDIILDEVHIDWDAEEGLRLARRCNTRNHARFLKMKEEQLKLDCFLCELYSVKAWHLYNEIRKHYLMGWWD